MLEIRSFNPEFGYELISVVPYAYYLHSMGEKIRVVSGYDMQPFYYFADEFILDESERSWYNVKRMNTPNRNIHKPALDLTQFKSPPYKEKYKGFYDYDIVICNRYNIEWSGVKELNRPINYFSEAFLFELFTKLKDKKIAYFNIDRSNKKYFDNAPPIKLNDYEVVKQFKNVHHISDIAKISKDSFNATQLKVMAGAKLFITMNGGYGIMSSFFGGKNIIYTNPVNVNGKIYPSENQTNDFNYYYLFGDSKIVNLHSYNDILNSI